MKKEFNIDEPFEQMIIRFLNGQLSVEETDELNRWIEESAENQEVFRSYQNIWLGSSIALPDERFSAHRGWKKISHQITKTLDNRIYKSRQRTRRLYISLGRVAALLAGFFTVGALASYLIISQLYSLAGDELSEISVPQGSRSHIVLPDSSIVWLNAGSKITYSRDFNRNERVLQLEGEAFFDVFSNPRKPFVVKTSHLNVVAYGTTFNVKAYPEEEAISATLVEGNIIVEIPGLDDRLLTYNLKPKQNFIYNIVDRSPGSPDILEQIKEEDELLPEAGLEEIPERPKARIYLKSNIKPELYTSWKDEIWIIEGESMAAMAVMLGRRFNTNINIHDDQLKGYRFTGRIMNETLEQVLEILRMTAPLRYSVGKGYVDWEIDPESKDEFDMLLNRYDKSI